VHVKVPGEVGANPHLKVPALLAGMIAGADSIDDMDLLRHGGTKLLLPVIRAPSTLGILLRAFSFRTTTRALRSGKCRPHRPGCLTPPVRHVRSGSWRATWRRRHGGDGDLFFPCGGLSFEAAFSVVPKVTHDDLDDAGEGDGE
jgi:hypothetical protein